VLSDLMLIVSNVFIEIISTRQVQYLLWLCVCPSIRLSQDGVLPKQLQIGLHRQYHTISQGL